MSEEGKPTVFLGQAKPDLKSQFTDPYFPPNENSLLATDKLGAPIDPKEVRTEINPAEIEWRRAKDIFPEPHLFENDISVNDVRQGKIGNCYFLSSIAALCEFPVLISDIFITKDYNVNGIYELQLYIDGEKQIVYLDDYFPCIKGTNVPYFAKPNSFELWVMLLEKAWAKINGGYANIVSGWPCDVMRALTGFGCESLDHKNNVERIWNIVRFVDQHNAIICSSTKASSDVNRVGLMDAHTYTLIDTEELEDDDKNPVRLVKLRNPWGESGWDGPWSANSNLWTEKIKQQVPQKKLKLNPGEFYMCVEDFAKYFVKTDICQIVYGGTSKVFNFNQGDLVEPQIFNIYVRKPGVVSVSVMEKNWRYHRELRGVSHPTSLLLAEYEPNINRIKHAFCDYESYQDTEKIRNLNPGYYILWVYKALAQSENPAPEFMKVKISSDADISVKHVGPDRNFEAIQQIIYEGVRHKKRKTINENEILYDVSNEFNRSGLGYRLVANPLPNFYQKWVVNPADLKGFALLPPYDKKDKFTFEIGPNDFGVIIGIQKQKFGKFSFNLKVEDAEQIECKEGDKPVKITRAPFDSFCTSNLDSLPLLTGDNTKTLEEVAHVEQYPTVNHVKKFIEVIKTQYPLIADALLKLKRREKDKDKKLGLIQLDKDNGVYIGEGDYNVPQGRGCFYFKTDGKIWIGYFDNGEKGNYGKLYDKTGRMVYEGDYANGLRNGQGTYYYPDGEKYVGEFTDGVREGQGCFYWNDGTSWEGAFKENEMDGKGMYSDGTDSWHVTYDKGDIVE